MNRRQAIQLVVFDLDNTLYDWAAFFAPALEEMVRAVALSMQVEERDVYLELREAYGRHGCLEYPFVVQTLPLVARLNSADRSQVVRRARTAFALRRDRDLRAYDGVRDTLEALRGTGRRLVAATNAPLFPAYRRLRHLELDQFFDGIAAKRRFPVPRDDPAIVDVVRREERGEYEVRMRHWEFPERALKPSTHMYERILDELGVRPWRTLVVGDSLSKDVAPALRLGAWGAWARYGTHPRRDLLHVLLRVTPWTSAAIEQHYAPPEVTGLPVLDRFDRVLDLV